MWNLSFISEEDFISHVKATIGKYGEKLESFDLKRFNKNIIDPIKLIFDKTVYQSSWEEIVSNEIFRQRDKSNNNDIGYFHQRIFQYIENCHVPANGEEGGWDVIYENADGIDIPDAGRVHTVYVEMKNKHNTMNSASAGKTFIKMQNHFFRISFQHNLNFLLWIYWFYKNRPDSGPVRTPDIRKNLIADKKRMTRICMHQPHRFVVISRPWLMRFINIFDTDFFIKCPDTRLFVIRQQTAAVPKLF